MKASSLAMRIVAVAIAAGPWGCRDLEVQEPFPC
jgi:hypothetical protein